MDDKAVNILLVEDEKPHVKLIQRAFESRAGEVSLTMASTLREARAHLAESAPDLLIVDLVLPDGKGTDLLSADKEECRFPIVLMTCRGTEQVAVEAMKAGVLDYVVKSEATFSDMPRIAERALRQWKQITEHKPAEEVLRESEERFRSIFEHSTIGMYRTTPDGHIVIANPALVSMLGYPSFEHLTRRNLEEDGYEHEFPHSAFKQRMEAEGRITGMESAWIRSDRSILFVRESATAVRNRAGNTLYYEGTVEDITERKRAEKAIRRAERLNSLSTLSAGIAHEINNPVGAAMLAAETALAIKDDPDEAKRFEKCLSNVVSSLDRCGRIVRNLLTFSRDEPAQKQPCQIGEVIQQSRDLARSYAERYRTTIRLALDRDLPEVVVGRLDMELALINLLRNAIEAGGKDGQVVIRAESANAGVRISVEDNGCGMTDEQKKHALDPFYTTRQSRGGTGLGLSITYGIVQDHGGTIEMKSAPGEGTTVTVTLPAHENLA